jgi:hypothetical protein
VNLLFFEKLAILFIKCEAFLLRALCVVVKNFCEAKEEELNTNMPAADRELKSTNMPVRTRNYFYQIILKNAYSNYLHEIIFAFF